ncbi:hypothetical protein BV20DRAFT_955601 [Pilatotrama ljubarskyi]|nr:hypothetical protein BV20DRAFT_955601 [Pilatotrama ljubarskyi]
MPRRTATPATPAPSAPLPPPPRDIAALAESDPQWAANLQTLRRHWKWANFSQFFYTFAPLLAMPDVFLADVEDDLARGTNLYLPRIMHRLLYTLSQDRKITIDNWQSALRRQYLRRAPELNPIGPEPKVASRDSSVAPSEGERGDVKEDVEAEPKPSEEMENTQPEGKPDGDEAESSHIEPKGESAEPKAEPQEDAEVPARASTDQRPKTEELEESKDWLDLPMLAKLDSLHLLTDWQFHNPYRVRQIMKDDDEAANWRIEPIGYDARTNAYWLIGPDRLWIQRVPPKPPRTRNLKRKRPTAPAKKASTKGPTSKAVESDSDDEEDEPVTRSKRTRTQSQSQPQTRTPANGRSTRASRRQTRASSPAPELSSPSKSTRAAKVQANKKLDIQAKELAEFQRQAAKLDSARGKAKANASPRASRRNLPSPAKRAMGTRISARLRRSTRGTTEDDDDDEWQQVPDEWLQESASSSRRNSARTRANGKARAVEDEDETENVDGEAVAEANADREAEADAQGEADEDGEEGGHEKGHQDGDADEQELLQKAGLESDAVSELTDLSDEPQDAMMAESDDAEEPPTKKRSTRGRRNVGGRKSAKQTRKARPLAKEKPPPVEDAQPEEQEEQEEEPPSPPLPADFVEWEAIAVTLPEWEHVADRFANTTHYLEKALYKTLSQNIVPFVTAELREQEKRRRIEEAIVHRKRSSRIALKESEKEEARLAAKRKAEEEEKMARAKRQEARLKKEEAERAKRERAREQRRKEREEREARARAKAERAERSVLPEAETSVARSTATPTVNGTQASSSVQTSRVVTPNGVRSPDWVLDCEVCHKQGVNVDDGLAMVSCGSCNRWQHIPCHDLNDQRSGRPRRNWEDQQFYCSRCRQRAMNGGAYGNQPLQTYPSHSQYSWSQGGRPPAPVPKPTGVDPYTPTPELRYSHRSPVENGVGYHQQSYSTNHVGAASYSRSSHPNTGFSFSQYQPDQRTIPSRSVVPNTAPTASWTNGGGYVTSPEHMTGRMQSAHFVPQYAHSGGVYASNRIPSAYQVSRSCPTSSVAQYDVSHNTPGTMSAARWPASSSTNGYHSAAGSAVQTAAESLAYMHDGGSRYGSSSTWPSHSYGQGQQHMAPSAQPSHSGHTSRPSYPPAPIGVDPLASHTYQAPRAEQQVGPSVTNGSSSFNFQS